MKRLGGLALLALTGCGLAISDDSACRAVAAMGMRDCTITARHWLAPELFGCGHDEQTGTGFAVDAMNASGQRVHVLVCCGWPLKACTVRGQ